MILLAAQVVLASFLLAKRDDTVDFIVDKMDNVMTNEKTTGLRDVIQTSFSCCGLEGKDFYRKDVLPRSCCKLEGQEKECRKFSRGNEKYGKLNEDGCRPTYKDWLNNKVQIVVIVLFAVSLVELIAVSFSCYLSKST